MLLSVHDPADALAMGAPQAHASAERVRCQLSITHACSACYILKWLCGTSRWAPCHVTSRLQIGNCSNSCLNLHSCMNLFSSPKPGYPSQQDMIGKLRRGNSWLGPNLCCILQVTL